MTDGDPPASPHAARSPAATVPAGLSLPEPPPYATGTLADVLPAAATALGVDGIPSRLELPAAARAVVLLVDGLGAELLSARSGHAPFLRSLRPGGRVLSAGFPSTTATSMGSFGTGLPPGGHGMVGYEVLDTQRDRLLNELAWDGDVNPRTWQSESTVFERVVRAGTDVVRIGPGFFDGSGLTEAALRGGRFVAAATLDQRVQAALAALRSSPSVLVYVYWGEVDKVGHEAGCGSWQWGEELALVDAAVRDLAAGMPSDTLLVVTADHGMVDLPAEGRLDIDDHPDLLDDVVLVGGEARFRHLYCRAGAAGDVQQRWRERLGTNAVVLTRDDAEAAGWFGPLTPAVRPRVGDVVVAALGAFATFSRRLFPVEGRMVGFHGSLTPQEMLVPLLIDAPGS